MTARPTLGRLMAAIAGISVVLGSYRIGRDSVDRPTTVYVTRTGARYHREGCPYARAGAVPVPLPEARAGRYRACSACRPPTR